MAIKMKRPAFEKLSAVKEFTGRKGSRKAFWSSYEKMVKEGSTVITFYGAGGVGKTALLKKLEEEIKHRDQLTRNECKYVKYDFNNSTDLREVLKAFKSDLLAYGCEFPLFDLGNYYYSLKVGQDVTPLKAKSMMEKIPWIGELKKNLSKIDAELTKVNPMLKTAKMFFEVTDEVFQAIPVTKAMTTCFSIVDKFLIDYMEQVKVWDEEHKAVRNQLNACRQEKNPIALYEFLPTLFAMDVADWIAATGNKLIVLLDNYESLVGTTTLATDEQLKRDLWLRGDEGLIFMIPDTLWTIAGRNKLRWSGELADETDQHLIKALSPEDSNWFLKNAGVVDENLRDELVKLTEGYPIFLDLCVDVYTEYKNRHNAEPTIDEFGQKREEVVSRIFRYLDAAGDDAAKDMLEFLCLLNVWTDEIALTLGEKALHNFSHNTYKRVKNFSFIQSERVTNEEFDLRIFRFDKTIQSILVTTCNEKLIADVKAAVNEFFQNFFAGKRTFDAKEIFYLKLWANFILHFADNSETLREQYEDKLKNYVEALIENANFGTAEEILSLFVRKLENLDEMDSALHIALEKQLGRLKYAQGNYKGAYNFMKSAYEKCTRLLGEENPDTVNIMNDLAVTLIGCGRYDEALPLQENVFRLRKKIFGENHPDTLTAMNNLASTFGDLGRDDEAVKLQEKVLRLRKKNLGEENRNTLTAMNNLAVTLSKLNRHDKARELQEKVLVLRKKILGDEHLETIAAMHNLSVTFNCLKRYDEALKLSEQVLNLRKKILGENHPDTVNAMNNLANLLSELNRHAEALELRKKILAWHKEIFGEENSDTVAAMTNVANSLSELDRYAEALELREKVLAWRKENLGEENLETIEAMYKLADSWSLLDHHEEAVKLGKDILKLCKKIHGKEHRITIKVMCNLAASLYYLQDYEEVFSLWKNIFALCQKTFGAEHRETLNAMNNLAWTLEKLDRKEDALYLRENVLALRKKNLGDNHPDTVRAMNNLANLLCDLGHYDKALELQKKILRLYKKNLAEEHLYTIKAMHNLAVTLINLKRHKEAETLIEKALKLAQKNFGDEHPETKEIIALREKILNS